ncbi:DUF4252 domain-containing protein [Aquiflexum gelatinilyticum]|uniref:DUF4252 domain-containing protein n=1 Tax=Aquiflexum gelatinilyticum TaxID=2961943 RepID=A0A9X2P7X8_9BACT|nr:DUF4252 domain-containing protein [Aquiflexum gelatinilyticum]MCR9015147.1 DUF4252 domain-containing protein [Aquiflexum gelatinilyticum]
MKRIIPIIVLTLLVTGVNAQDDAISKFFSKYMEDENFSRVYISPKMMQMAGGFLKSASEDSDQEAEDLGELISKVRGIRILSTETTNGKSLYQEAMNTLNKNKYEDLMDVADKGSNVKFMVREENGLVKEFLMISGSGESFTLLSMLGNFTYQDLNMLAEKTNMPGIKEYQDGNKKK